jgi:hypothetical protein
MIVRVTCSINRLIPAGSASPDSRWNNDPVQAFTGYIKADCFESRRNLHDCGAPYKTLLLRFTREIYSRIIVVIQIQVREIIC